MGVVKMVIQGHKYEVEIPRESRYARESKAIIKVDGQVKEYAQAQQQAHIIYADQLVYIVRYIDGVYAVSDGKRIEVKTHQLFLRDRATGLCGDLNGEWSADLRSARKCVVPKHKLAAVSFMIEDGKCQGIPQQEKSELQRYEQRCVRKTELPTKVTQIFSRYLNS